MKLTRLLPSAVLLAFVLLQPRPSRAASSALSDAGLSDAARSVFGASRLPVPVESARVPGQARVIGVAGMESSAGKTLADVLRSVPGVVIYDQVGNEYQPTVDLRGFNATPVPATVVLIDGVRVNEPDFGQVNWQLLPLSEVERVEVLSGPQTLYGPGALGGVINVTTKRGGKKIAAEAGADVGSFGLQRQRLSVGGPAGPVTYRVEASHEAEDGWRRNSGARLYRLSSRVDYRGEKTELGLGYRFAADDLKQAGALTAAEAGADPRQNVSFVHNDSLLHQGTLSARRGLTDETAVSFLGDVRRRLENTPLNQGRSSVSQARAEMNGLSGTVQLDDRRAVLGRASALTAGVELARDSTDSSSSGKFSGFGFTNANADVQRKLGVFAQESFDLLPRTLILTAGGRWDRTGLQHEDRLTESNSGSRQFFHFSPRAGLNWNPIDAVEAFASIADSFRAPTSDEINALGPFTSAPQLKPVKARSFELGSRVRFGAWGEGSASVYRTIVHDEIFPVFDPTAGFGQNTNLDKTRRDGLELSVKPRWGDVADGFVNYGYTEATFQTDFKLDKAPFPATQQVRRGSDLPAVPRHRIAFGANVHPVKGATVGLDELCVSSQRMFGDESNTEPSLGGYCVLGGGASYEKGAVRVFVRADNLLDRRYETRGILGTNTSTFGLERYVTPAPGVSFSTGVRVRVGG
jgi:iron complex outermembrane receptor protein